MTSQIAVFNLDGVAVASDSVTTVSNRNGSRTFPGAQKIYDLGPNHRSVVMACGSSRFMNVPYSVLIPQWKATLDGPMPRDRDYAESFAAWLPSRKDLFGDEQQVDFLHYLVRDYFLSVRSRILHRLEEQELTDAPWDGVDVRLLVDDVVSGYQRALENLEDLDGRDAGRDAEFLAAHQEAVQEEFDFVFDDTPRTPISDDILREAVPLLVLGKQESWGSNSTLAFIGYGAEDTFPGHQTLALTGMVNDRVMMHRWEESQISVSNESLLTPFAQDEAIHTFLRAYNRQFPGIGHDSIDALVEEFASRFDVDREILEELREQAHKEFGDSIESWSWQQFISPMLDTVGSLPLIDLARMAESLVGIQALRAQSTTQQPSVGGNIALLTISPENGVTWLRRHTEPSSLTPQGALA